MAKHEVIIHENTGVTKESAPYLGSYVSKETIKSDAFAAKIAERCGLPAIQVQAILAGTFDEIERLQKESLVRVHLDGLMVCGIITGSFPTADAAFDSNRNALQLAVRLDEDVRNELADVTPTIVTDITVTKLRVDNVMDIAIPRPYNLIHGRHHFSVAGFKMVLGDEGAEVYLQNGHGATFPVVIDEIKSSQLFTAHTATLLEPGDYKLIVKSRGGDAEGPLQTVFRKVKYLAVEDPPTKRVVITAMSAVKADGMTTVNVCGTDLDGVTGHVDDGVSRHLNAELFVNGTSKGTVEMRGPSGGEAVEYYFHEGVDVGDTVKVVLHIDPAKIEFDPNDVSREATVTGD